jgi:hypothetical protein
VRLGGGRCSGHLRGGLGRGGGEQCRAPRPVGRHLGGGGGTVVEGSGPVGAARWLVVGGGGGDAVDGSRERSSYA